MREAFYKIVEWFYWREMKQRMSALSSQEWEILSLIGSNELISKIDFAFSKIQHMFASTL
jgi:hypothetical protein